MPEPKRWWAGDAREQYWCEITGRADIGVDLHCAQTRENGRADWSYELIRNVRAGEIIFHYDIRPKHAGFVGASVALGPLIDAEVAWKPRGSSGRADPTRRGLRPGWRLPLVGFKRTSTPLTREELNEAASRTWLLQWISTKGPRAMAPLQMNSGRLRAQQAYLTKMPREWVEHFSQLAVLADLVAETQDDVVGGVPHLDDTNSERHLVFKPKNEADYVALISERAQVKTRHHERLVRIAGHYFERATAVVSNPHPIDLLMTAPHVVIFEAKAVGSRDPSFAVREAIGQLLEYRHYVGPSGAALCILLDKEPASHVVRFVEDAIGMGIAWLSGDSLLCGPKTASSLPGVPIGGS